MDEELGSASITITLDDTGAVRDAEQLGERIRRALDRASRNTGVTLERNIQAAIRRISPVRIRVEADLRPFSNSIDTLSNFDAVRIPVVPDIDPDRFRAEILSALAGIEVPVRVVPDLSGFDAAIRAHRPPSVTVSVNADTDRFSAALSGLGNVAGRAGSALGGLLRIGALGIAAAGAAQSVTALTAALAPAVGLLAAGPAVILGYQAALGALRLALSGVSDAFSTALTGSAEQFNEALENLSPAAQAAAREVRELRPAFEDLRESVQDAFFGQLEGQITATARALGGPLQSGLSAIALEWGRAARNVLGYVQGAQGVDNVTSVLLATRSVVESLSETTSRLTAGFLQVGAAVADAFGGRLAGALASAGNSFGSFLQRAAESGQAVAWVEGAVTVLGQLGRVLGNVGGILSGVFQAGNDAGAGLLNNLIEITGEVSRFVNSAQGAEALGNIFGTIGSIAAQLGPILSALVTQVGAIAPALAPVFETLGPALVSVIDSLGPALAAIAPSLRGVASGLAEALAAVGPALGPLGESIGGVVDALSPILPVVGELAASLGTVLTPIVHALAAAITPLVSALSGALSPILPTLTRASLTLTAALGPLVQQLGVALAEALTAASPLLTALADGLAQLAVGLTPVIAQLADTFIPVFQQMGPLINQVSVALAPLIDQFVTALVPILPTLVESLLAVQTAFLPLIPTLAQLVVATAPFVSLILSAITPIAQFAAGVLNWQTMNVVMPVINGIVGALNFFITTVTTALNLVRNFAPTVTGLFSSMASSVTTTVSNMASAVVSFFRQLPSQAADGVRGIISTVTGVFNSAKSAVEGVVRDLANSVVSTVRGIPNDARNALGNIGSVLTSAGRDLIRGMIGGVRDMASSLVDAARDVVSNAVDAVTGFLGISSPSKLFREIGRFTGQGLINGLTSTASDIERTSEQLAGLIRDAFRGRNTNLDNVLIAQVQSTSNRLERLATQREAIARRIQEANQFAANVQQNALNAFNLQSLSQAGGGVGGIIDGIDAAIRQVQRFNRQINALAERGLRRDLLSQIIGLGPQQGASIASQLANASNAQLRELNEAQRQLTAASRRLGRDSADQLFDAGQEASRGFLAGLRDQQDDIEELMLTIARSMQSAIRNALGIRSPSRVFRRIGRFTMDGLSAGVDDRLGSVRRSAIGAVSAITDPFRGSPGVGAPGVPVGRQSGAQSASGNRSQVNNFTINEVGNAEATAQRIINRLALAGGGL